MKMRRLFAGLVGFSLAAAPFQVVLAQEENGQPNPAPRTELWGELYAGMGPEKAKQVIEATKGVKRAKYKKSQNGISIMDVNVDSDFVLGGREAQIGMTFKDDRLMNVHFMFPKTSECIVGAAKTFNFFNEALGSKYALSDGMPNVDSDLVKRLAMESNAAAYRPQSASDIPDVQALYTDGGDLLVQTTLVTTAKKHSDSDLLYAKLLDCREYGHLDGQLLLTYMSKRDVTDTIDEDRDQRRQETQSAADDL